MEGWEYWIERRVFIILKNNRQYSGLVLAVDKEHLMLLDKFDKRITFLLSEIKLIQEEGRRYGKREN